MALSENFSTGQTLGLSNKITLTDLSTGSDVLVVARRVYLTDNKGNTYVETEVTTEYNVWANFPSTTTITLDVLTQDRCLWVRVDWVDVSGNVRYTKTVLTLFYLYARTYRIFLVKCMSSRPKLPDLANFYYNFMRLNSSIKEAITSVEDITDISSAQAALNRAYQLINNKSYFF